MPAGTRFTFTCAVQTVGGRPGQGYLVTATGAAGGVVGSVYTIDHNNTRQTTRFKGTAVARSCWIIGGSEC
jgi:hypothetical protein